MHRFLIPILLLPLYAADIDPRHRIQGSPLDRLPPNIELLTTFGERQDISPDNKRVAFITKSFGDAMVIDLATRRIDCLTCGVPHAAFLRIMHLSTGDYILMGPEHFDWGQDPLKGREANSEMWFLGRQPGSMPQRLGMKLFEGMAISKKSMKVAWSQFASEDPSIPEGVYRMFTADVRIAGGKAELVNRRQVAESHHPPCKLEPQDFFDNDTKMTMSCYTVADPKQPFVVQAQVMVLDLKTGKYENNSKAPGIYQEPEGIFPDGRYTCVESDKQAMVNGKKVGEGWQIDLWKLRLDGTGKDFQRITHFNDFEGYHASNPVVSTDGRFMVFSIGRAVETGMSSGAGHGILIYHFDK